MYTDKKKLFCGIILILVAVLCVVQIVRGNTEVYSFIGIAVGLFFGIAFLHGARPKR